MTQNQNKTKAPFIQNSEGTDKTEGFASSINIK